MDKSNSFAAAMTGIERYPIRFRIRRERSYQCIPLAISPRPFDCESVVFLLFYYLFRCSSGHELQQCRSNAARAARPSATGYAHRWHTWFLFMHNLHFYGFRSAPLPLHPLRFPHFLFLSSEWNAVSDTICIYLHIASQRIARFMPDFYCVQAKTLR